jgi:hypothetical protein
LSADDNKKENDYLGLEDGTHLGPAGVQAGQRVETFVLPDCSLTGSHSVNAVEAVVEDDPLIASLAATVRNGSLIGL